MEHVEGISLYDYVKLKNYEGRYLPEDEVRIIIKQLLEGISYMHQKNIAHRDLKLDNILIIEHNKKNDTNSQRDTKNNFTIKIIDFGFSVTTEKL